MNNNQHTTWVVVSNTNTCRIYKYSKKPEQLALIKEIEHPENRLRDIELTSDKPGRYNSNGSAHGAFTQESDPKEILINEFARDIVNDLDKARNIQAYETLIMIAPPHMSGLLFHHINKHVKDLVTHSIKKDIVNLTEPELATFLQQNT